jgi:broad specificity phosphatase PhoE
MSEERPAKLQKLIPDDAADNEQQPTVASILFPTPQYLGARIPQNINNNQDNTSNNHAHLINRADSTLSSLLFSSPSQTAVAATTTTSSSSLSQFNINNNNNNSSLLQIPTASPLNSSSTNRSGSYHGLAPLIDNPTPQVPLGNHTVDRLVIVMVGLPARGKSFVARRICQYLSFFHGASCKVFNVGEYRRKRVGAKTPASWFGNDNTQSSEIRKELARQCMNDLKAWVLETEAEGRIAVYDATNTTHERREWILNELQGIVPTRNNILFVESVVNDQALVENNVREVKVSMPDYDGMSPEDAVADFKARIAAYEAVYEPMGTHTSDCDLCWVRVEDGGRFVAMNRIRGYLQGRICQLLSTLHTIHRPIYLTRHGQSEYNKLGKIGGDSRLSDNGEEYAKHLARYVHQEILGLNPDGTFPDPTKRTCVHAKLYTSSLIRTKDTARHIVHSVCDDGWIIMRPRAWRNMDEIFAGSFDGMTYEEIEAIAPEEFADRAKNKLSYRYPRGESYLDVIDRLEPVVMELERQRDPVLVVGHQGILRILHAYFTGKTRQEAPFASIPLNTVIKLVPGTYKCEEHRIRLLSPPVEEGSGSLSLLGGSGMLSMMGNGNNNGGDGNGVVDGNGGMSVSPRSMGHSDDLLDGPPSH